jgi:putative ABC transport system permease protein
MPAIGGVMRKDATLESFEQTLAQSLNIFTTILATFASVIAVAVVYNAARIALSERGRELASLRVLGFTRRETTLMLLGEQGMLLACALPLGAVMGYGVSALLSSTYQWELFRMPLFVSPRTYAFALLVICLAAVFSAVLVRRRLDRLDLVEVLKTRE